MRLLTVPSAKEQGEQIDLKVRNHLDRRLKGEPHYPAAWASALKKQYRRLSYSKRLKFWVLNREFSEKSVPLLPWFVGFARLATRRVLRAKRA